MSKISQKKKTVTQILREGPYLQDLPEGRLILAIAEKESATSLFNNDRLLIFNGRDKVIGYAK